MNSRKNSKKRLFEVMSRLDKTFKINENKSIDEGWKDWTAGAIATAATMGTMGDVQAKRPVDKNIDKTEIVNEFMFKTPNDVIQFANDIVNNKYSVNDIQNITNTHKQKIYDLIKTDNTWKGAFDKALEIISNYQRRNAKFQIFLKTENAKKIGNDLNINVNKTYNLNDRKKLTQEMLNKGLKRYADFVFMVVDKGIDDWAEMEKKYQAMDYINGFSVSRW